MEGVATGHALFLWHGSPAVRNRDYLAWPVTITSGWHIHFRHTETVDSLTDAAQDAPIRENRRELARRIWRG